MIQGAMSLSNFNVEAALEILRATKHVVGPATVKDGIVYVAVDGAPRKFEEIFDMVEDYDNDSKAAS